MNGEGFNHKVNQGDKVKAGDVLGTFDSAKIAAAGLDNTTMVIVTNTADFASVNPVASGSVAKGDAIIEVKSLIKSKKRTNVMFVRFCLND